MKVAKLKPVIERWDIGNKRRQYFFYKFNIGINNMYELKKDGFETLYQEALPVEVDEDISELLDAMWKIMLENNGIGLAANQVGVLKRVFIMQVGRIKQEFINPIITFHHLDRYKKVSFEEGCLSFPDRYKKKTRRKKITICGNDRNWNEITLKLSGLAAACAQHEYDHLDGITIF